MLILWSFYILLRAIAGWLCFTFTFLKNRQVQLCKFISILFYTVYFDHKFIKILNFLFVGKHQQCFFVHAGIISCLIILSRSFFFFILLEGIPVRYLIDFFVRIFKLLIIHQLFDKLIILLSFFLFFLLFLFSLILIFLLILFILLLPISWFLRYLIFLQQSLFFTFLIFLFSFIFLLP